MVVIPAGAFFIGSNRDEQDLSVAEGRGRQYTDRESPQHSVTIARDFAVGAHEVTRDQFEVFVREAKHRVEPGCQTYEPRAEDGVFKRTSRADRDWRDPGYAQRGDHPVVCLAWDDASAYVTWLARKTGQPYRLLTEAEWEYAARAGTTTSRYWGDDPDKTQSCAFANVADRTPNPWGKPYQNDHMYDCDDGYAVTSPVGSLKPNAFGLYDMIGNVWEWLEDCAHANYVGAPVDGSAWREGGDCMRRALRGGAFHENSAYARTAIRGFNTHFSRYSTDGFRVARDLSSSTARRQKQQAR